MQFINQLFTQIRQLLESMTPGSRMIAGLLLLCVVVSSAFLVRGSSSSSTEYLLGGRDFTDGELDNMESAFGTAGLHGYERVGRRMKIPTAERSQYSKALHENNAMPRQLGSSMDDAFAGNFLEPMDVQHQRARNAKEKDISNAIKQLPFVEDAYITTDIQNQGYAKGKKQTASIWVRPKANYKLSQDQRRAIMRQVENSFAGLIYDNISFTDMSDGTGMSGAHDPLSSEDQKYFIAKAQQESELKRKAEEILQDYGDTRIAVQVELDTTLREASELVKYNEKPTTLRSNETKKETESAKPGPGGRPGAYPNATGINQSANLEKLSQESSKQKESSITEQRIAGTETTVVDKVGLVPKSASIAVSIPKSYYRKHFQRQWLDQNPDKTEADLASIDPAIFAAGITQVKADVEKEIQRSLATLLPPEPPGGDRFPRITVKDHLDAPDIVLPEAKLSETVLAYAKDNWQMIGMFVLAIGVMLFLRSVSRATPSGNTDTAFENGFSLQLDDPATWDLSSLGGDAEEGLETAGVGGGSGESGPRNRKFNTTGGEIKEELTSLVRENPDAAASLLRTWIGDSA